MTPEESRNLPLKQPGPQMTAAEEAHFYRNVPEGAPKLLTPEKSRNLPLKQSGQGQAYGGHRLSPEEVEHFQREFRHELQPAERQSFARELEVTARTLEEQKAPLDVVARLRELDVETASTQDVARELEHIQQHILADRPDQVAELAALRAHVPQIYDADNNRFFDRPEEVTPERMRQVVLDAGALEAHRRFGNEISAVTLKLKAAELEAANTEPHEAVAMRMKGHTKALATKLAMKVVIGVLPPQLQVPVRLAYHAAKLGQKITGGMRHEL